MPLGSGDEPPLGIFPFRGILCPRRAQPPPTLHTSHGLSWKGQGRGAPAVDRTGPWALPGSANCLLGAEGELCWVGWWAWRGQDSLRWGRGQSQTPHLATVGALPVPFIFFSIKRPFSFGLVWFASERVNLEGWEPPPPGPSAMWRRRGGRVSLGPSLRVQTWSGRSLAGGRNAGHSRD